jgi:glucose/arabinose dehydrogenase
MRRLSAVAIVAALSLFGTAASSAGPAGPSVVDPQLTVRTVIGGLALPTSIAFLEPNDFLVLEKNTGKVQRVRNGVVTSTVLDLSVNNASERGLLGIALHPNFPTNPSVYLFWTCRAAPPPPESPFFPTATRCSETPELGADTADILAVPLLGNRVDRFRWNGSTLAFDRNLIMLRAFQNDAAPIPAGQGDAAQPARGNHDGGWLQNLSDGPTAPGVADDQFGGPEPDDAHLTGVTLRLNDDGSTPSDNPFFAAGAALGGQVGANIQKILSYGIRNSFGMAFDPLSGGLWNEQNGDDSFTELNRVEPGENAGWVQIMGPAARIAQYKAIETSTAVDPVTGTQYFGLQQERWSPTNIADTQQDALSRLFMLPGAHYSDPEFSWKFEIAPAGIGFLNSTALGPQYRGDLFVGAARTLLENGFIWRFNLTGNRRKIATDDPRLEDRVADNNNKFDITESESLLFGRDFGIATDLKTGPNGNLFVVSLDQGAVYEIARR